MNLEELKKKMDLAHDYLSLLNDFDPSADKYAGNFLQIIDDKLGEFNTIVNECKSIDEPNTLEGIKSLRPDSRQIFNVEISKEEYREKLSAALLGRMIGCTLGAPVEQWSIERMEMLAQKKGQSFPLTDYWKYIPFENEERYGLSKMIEYTKGGMKSVPADDDIVYTLLNLLILEEHGINFTTEDISKAWLKYLPYACTAEEITLNNLQNGISWSEAGNINNPYIEWIGAAIRADSFGYVAPGKPELAAKMAYHDAYLSHRRNGIYGEMLWAAVISAAFIVDDPLMAVEIGLYEIPGTSRLAEAVRWALDNVNQVSDYNQARKLIDVKFPGMSQVHTINNACAVIFGLALGGKNFTAVIGNTVAIGLDNDCTAATAGSVIGAILGKSRIEQHWFENFNNRIVSYLKNENEFLIDNVLNRFEKVVFHKR
ncbi:MAG: ADP-ribosylglycohydrolase family protein [Melioribacteraceae bacterium]|nr:ADP-ribosylglycohydrolase family protein [Melioribacteraceae bacterium]MCF8353175.1 ADP-ribosylglycohydrolase family protein [Melioribacteraceae bacterium]